MTISMPIGRMTESGEYRIENDQLVFSRSNGDTSWPFRTAGETLVITESETEAHEYVRIAVANCKIAAAGDNEIAKAVLANHR